MGAQFEAKVTHSHRAFSRLVEHFGADRAFTQLGQGTMTYRAGVRFDVNQADRLLPLAQPGQETTLYDDGAPSSLGSTLLPEDS